MRREQIKQRSTPIVLWSCDIASPLSNCCSWCPVGCVLHLRSCSGLCVYRNLRLRQTRAAVNRTSGMVLGGGPSAGAVAPTACLLMRSSSPPGTLHLSSSGIPKRVTLSSLRPSSGWVGGGSNIPGVLLGPTPSISLRRRSRGLQTPSCSSYFPPQRAGLGCQGRHRVGGNMLLGHRARLCEGSLQGGLLPLCTHDWPDELVERQAGYIPLPGGFSRRLTRHRLPLSSILDPEAGGSVWVKREVTGGRYGTNIQTL